VQEKRLVALPRQLRTVGLAQARPIVYQINRKYVLTFFSDDRRYSHINWNNMQLAVTTRSFVTYLYERAVSPCGTRFGTFDIIAPPPPQIQTRTGGFTFMEQSPPPRIVVRIGPLSEHHMPPFSTADACKIGSVWSPCGRYLFAVEAKNPHQCHVYNVARSEQYAIPMQMSSSTNGDVTAVIVDKAITSSDGRFAMFFVWTLHTKLSNGLSSCVANVVLLDIPNRQSKIYELNTSKGFPHSDVQWKNNTHSILSNDNIVHVHYDLSVECAPLIKERHVKPNTFAAWSPCGTFCLRFYPSTLRCAIMNWRTNTYYPLGRFEYAWSWRWTPSGRYLVRIMSNPRQLIIFRFPFDQPVSIMGIDVPDTQSVDISVTNTVRLAHKPQPDQLIVQLVNLSPLDWLDHARRCAMRDDGGGTRRF